MTDAAQVDPNMPPDAVVETAPEAAPVEPQAESATAQEGNDAPSEQGSNRVQERINKITADKYAEKRRADELERKIAELQSQVPQQPVVSNDSAPKLEDFEYDESRFQEALIDYKVNQKAAQITQQQEAQQAKQRELKLHADFNAKVAEFTAQAPDYQEAISNIPQLPQDTLDAVMQSDNGPKLAYYLGKHLDVADEIANASPMVAAMKLGEISAQLSVEKPTIQPSAAPDPIEPISSGGSISKSFEEMSMDELMQLR